MARQRFVTKKQVCECDADETEITTVIVAWRGNPKVKKRSQMVYHRTDGSFFWHWRDQPDLKGIPPL